jgi:GNAT superfamily N-acetyltransferase
MSSVEHRYPDRSNVRPVDALRDMPTVLDLIEIGFKDELDPQGWKLLKQMRSATHQTGLSSMRSALRVESSGFVWEEDGKVVANLSLRTALPSVTRGRLIGNVVVHPDYRGRGIGRELLTAAIQAARSEGARWIGLEVRQQNTVACGLYKSFGFRQVGSIYHLLRRANISWGVDNDLNTLWRKSKPQDKGYWLKLADTVYGQYQKRVLEIRDYQFVYSGIKRWVHLWFNGQHESAWLNVGENPSLAVCVKTDRRYHFHEWDMLIHADEDEVGAGEMVAKAIAETKYYPPWTVIALIPRHESLAAVLIRAGFHIHRTLMQMMLEL